MKPWLFLLIATAFAQAASISVSSPADGHISSTQNLMFSFTPQAEYPLETCALWSNKTASWAQTQTNQSAVANASQTTITSTFSDGFYLWGITCAANQTFYSANRTLRVDTTPPSAVSNLNASGNATWVNVSWGASQDATSVYYVVSRNGTVVTNVSTTFYTETVSSGQSYNYSIRSVDQAGLSSSVNSILFTPPAQATSAGVITLSGIVVVTTSNMATFSWSVSSASNASVTYGNETTVLGIVSNPSFQTTHTLTVAGLSPAKTYTANIASCNATACGNSTMTFTTLPSSYPSPTTYSVNASTASTWAMFNVSWTDSLPLSYHIFSSNTSGSWVNASARSFNGTTTYATHIMLLGSTTHTLAWRVYANNSQNAWNVTPIWMLPVRVPDIPTPTPSATPTPVPTTTPTSIPTPQPTTTPTPVASTAPTAVPTASPLPSAAPASEKAISSTNSTSVAENKTQQNLTGIMNEFILLPAENAEVALSPTGLIIGIDSGEAPLRFSTNFTNLGNTTTLLLKAVVRGPSGVIELVSTALNVSNGESVFLETKPVFLGAGKYDVEGKVLSLSGDVLAKRALVVHIASKEDQQTFAALAGLLVALLGVGLLLVFQLKATTQYEEKD